MKRVVVHIDGLVLRGFRHPDRHAVSSGLQAELGRLLAQPGAAERVAALGSMNRLDGGSVRVGTGMALRAIGAAAARAIGSAIER
jgi:hypothetical protein